MCHHSWYSPHITLDSLLYLEQGLNKTCLTNTIFDVVNSFPNWFFIYFKVFISNVLKLLFYETWNYRHFPIISKYKDVWNNPILWFYGIKLNEWYSINDLNHVFYSIFVFDGSLEWKYEYYFINFIEKTIEHWKSLTARLNTRANLTSFNIRAWKQFYKAISHLLRVHERVSKAQDYKLKLCMEWVFNLENKQPDSPKNLTDSYGMSNKRKGNVMSWSFLCLFWEF